MTQDGAKMGQYGGKMEPHWRFGGLREALGSQDGPTWGQDGAKMGYDGPTWDQDEAKMGATSQRCVAQRLRVEFRGGQSKKKYIYKLPINRSSGPILI